MNDDCIVKRLTFDPDRDGDRDCSFHPTDPCFVWDDPLFRSAPDTGAIEDAFKKLKDVLKKNGRVVNRDIYEALGISNPSHSHGYMNYIVCDVSSPMAGMRIKRELDAVYATTYMQQKMPKGLKPVRMWVSTEGHTTVEWDDYTKTTVQIENGGRFSEYAGFCACVAKKLYGSTSNAIRLMKIADASAKWPSEKKQIEREKLKKMRMDRDKFRREEEKRNRERRIQAEMDAIYAKREAERRVAEEDAKKVNEQ